MRPPATLLFDLDGTLADSALTIAAALSELSARRGGGSVAVESVRRLVSKGAPVLVREVLGPLAGDPAEDVRAFRAILADIPADPAMIYDGVVGALEALAHAGRACAVVTNKPETLARLLLDQLDLTRFFGAVVGGDTLAVCKPDPAPLRHACAQLGAREDALMIGDSEVDARAAGAAGMPFLLYSGGYEADGCGRDAVVGEFAAFADLPRLIAAVEARLSIVAKVRGSW